MKKTYFASPERSTVEQLDGQIRAVCNHPMLDGLLQLSGGCIAVLNSHRQIVAVNETLLKLLGLNDVEQTLGLRPGEALHCTHSRDMPDGCGTSQACASCGAAIAIVSSLGTEQSVEKTCSVSMDRDGLLEDIYFRVTASPLRVDDELFVLLFLQDISRRQQLESLERVFFHDINNTLMGLLTACDLLMSAKEGDEADKMAGFVRHLSNRLHQEITMQRYLVGRDKEAFEPKHIDVDIDWILDEVKRMVSYHPAALQKQIQCVGIQQKTGIKTDVHILQRVLINMLINALEATEIGDTVRLAAEIDNGHIIFSVWNAAFMPPEISQRVFQKNFSSKGKWGRGLGTYSMKLFGEKILGGRLHFTSTPQDGTTFYFSLPPRL